MSRPCSLFAVICACALPLLSGCSGCQQAAPKPDSAPREKTSDARAPAADTAAAAQEPSKSNSPHDDTASAKTAAPEAPSAASADAREAESPSDTPAAESPQTTAKSGKTAKTPTLTPAEARTAAQAALRESSQLAAAGDDAGAYRAALAGWEAARRGPRDPQLQRLTAQLLGRVKQSGEAATVKVPARTDKASVLE